MCHTNSGLLSLPKCRKYGKDSGVRYGLLSTHVLCFPPPKYAVPSAEINRSVSHISRNYKNFSGLEWLWP